MKQRRKARELALQCLYAGEVGLDTDYRKLLETIADSQSSARETKDYALRLVTETIESKIDIDSILEKHTANWQIERMAVVDRNILRMAVAELRTGKEVPFRVVIDEAVELAKEYSGDESGKFVNGVIDAVFHEMAENPSRKESR